MEKKYPIGEVRVYFVFKHPKTGEEMSSKLYTPLELLDTDLSIISERTCVCDCKPVGETNVVECNCEDYYQEFQFHAYHVEGYQPPAEAERGKEITVFVPCSEDDPRCTGSYTSSDGQCLCHVRGTTVPVIEQGAVWLTGQYDRLYDQLKAEPERKVVCWVDYSWNFKDANPTKFRDICTVRGEKLEFVSRGHGYGGADMMIGWDDEKKYFLEECERLYVQWLDEGGEKEVNNG